MARLIDADALIEAMTKFSNATGEDMTHGIFYAHIAPTIDAEPEPEIIRCRDCIYYYHSSNKEYRVCFHHKGCVEPRPSGYCVYAERKTYEAD